MFNLPEKIVVFDTEYTTWEGTKERNWSGPGEYKEIVQIGAVAVETERFAELDSFVVFVRPVKNPVLSQLFIDLTGITQAKIAQEGISFSQALESFYQWCEGRELYCYGGDKDTLQLNCALLGIEFPFTPSRFHNVKDVFKQFGILADGYLSSTIVEAFGKKPTRKAHDALNDARTIVDGLQCLKEN